MVVLQHHFVGLQIEVAIVDGAFPETYSFVFVYYSAHFNYLSLSETHIVAVLLDLNFAASMGFHI